MRIAFGIDDTLCHTARAWTKAANNWYRQYFKGMKRKKVIDRHYRYLLDKRWGLTEEQKESFYKYISENVDWLNLKPTRLIRLAKQLKEEGHDIFIITSRNNASLGADCEEKTMEWIEKQLGGKDKGNDVLVWFASDKATLCDKQDMDLLIDNDLSVMRQLFYASLHESFDLPGIWYCGARKNQDGVIRGWREFRKHYTVNGIRKTLEYEYQAKKRT